MGKDNQDRSKQTDDAAPPDPGDMADAAARQMPGMPPLAIDPGKRSKELARIAGERALAEAEAKASAKRNNKRET